MDIKNIQRSIRKIERKGLTEKLSKEDKSKLNLLKKTEKYTRKNVENLRFKEKRDKLSNESRSIKQKINFLLKKEPNNIKKIEGLVSKYEKNKQKKFKISQKGLSIKKSLIDLRWKNKTIKKILSDENLDLDKQKQRELMIILNENGRDIFALKEVLDMNPVDVSGEGLILTEDIGLPKAEIKDEEDQFPFWTLKDELDKKIDLNIHEEIEFFFPLGRYYILDPKNKIELENIITQMVNEIDNYRFTNKKQGSPEVYYFFDSEKRRITISLTKMQN